MGDMTQNICINSRLMGFRANIRDNNSGFRAKTRFSHLSFREFKKTICKWTVKVFKILPKDFPKTYFPALTILPQRIKILHSDFNDSTCESERKVNKQRSE